MYRCNKCDFLFEEPNNKKDIAEKYLGTDFFKTETKLNISICPNCNDDDIEELMECENCGEWYNEDELYDTTEMVNGGLGYCCEGCIEDADMQYLW